MSARIATIATVLVSLALTGAAAASSSDGGPGGLTAGTGCSVQCIQKALVTPTATYANVAIETTVPTKVVVTARRAGARGGLALAPDASFGSSILVTKRSVFLSGLKPDTTYTIVVKATDAQGRSDIREGTFQTLEVERNVDTGANTIDSGFGCSLQCISKALFTPVGGTEATIDVETKQAAKVTVALSREAPIQESWGPRFSFVEHSVSSPGLVTKWTAKLSQLVPGTNYHVIVTATDAEGRSSYQTGRVQMADRNLRITLLKIKVIGDADKGKNDRGEIKFGYWIGGVGLGQSGFRKIKGGQTVSVATKDTSRPGVTGLVTANGSDPTFDVKVHGVECDGVTMKNCEKKLVVESGSWWGESYKDHATATETFHLNPLLSNPLPPGFGVDLGPGHDAYFQFETTDRHLKFRVYGYLDVVFE